MNKVKNTFLALTLAVPVFALAGAIDNVGLDIPTPQQSALTSITEYTDEATWATALGVPTVINPYGDLADGVTVTNQYAPLGALYTDGDDVTVAYGAAIDGMLLQGGAGINVEFSDPVNAVGINYPGALRITGYLDGAEVFVSSDLGSAGDGFLRRHHLHQSVQQHFDRGLGR